MSDTLSADRSPLSSASSVRSFSSSLLEAGVGGYGASPSLVRMRTVQMLEYCLGHWSLGHVDPAAADADAALVEDPEPSVFKLRRALLSLADVLIRRIDTLPDRLACSLSALRIMTALAGTGSDAATARHHLAVLVDTAGRIAQAPVQPYDWSSPLPSSASQLFSLAVGNLSSPNFAARSCTHALLHELLRSMCDAMPDGQRPEQPVLDAFAKAHGARLLVSLTSVFSRELTLTSGPASGADPLSVGDILGLAVALADYTGLQAAAAASDDSSICVPYFVPLVAVRVPASEDPLLQSNSAPLIKRLIDSCTALPNRRAVPTANGLAISRLALPVLHAICLEPASPPRRNDPWHL
ncbi:hypothetical protein H696_03598 [Fonticula alba]|uniref:Uncharacterized protein n=1 Tax=Fonticula alba TaxID=691883 RepID=A0A058Z773_FONAL|nr:hypothetical protein H696_03598 [Fonticula alba]KCV70139.1 hypothetical protein H696_03598 [Fonticula alba]|eukprot:XP_009495745.1 hypothetical protein H696_03598 [Fonticula alba]